MNGLTTLELRSGLEADATGEAASARRVMQFAAIAAKLRCMLAVA